MYRSRSQEETLVSNRDRRRSVRQRVPVTRPVDIEYILQIPVTAQIADLGAGGTFIVTPNPLPAGTGLQYKLYLADDPKPIEDQARVVREEQTVGMAVEFQGLSEEEHERLKLFVASVLFKVPPGS